jgi:hypothetical protein
MHQYEEILHHVQLDWEKQARRYAVGPSGVSEKLLNRWM